MEILRPAGPFGQYAAPLRSTDFTLIDVGSSGGIDQCWRGFEPRLQVFGFDPIVDEVRRLQAAEPNPKVHFEVGFVHVPDDHPVMKRKGGAGNFSRTPWDRLAVAETVKITAEERAKQSTEEKTRQNAWTETELTDRFIFLPDFFNEKGIDSIDFVKIDIDGPDFDVLQSIEEELAKRRVLGVTLEVNYNGGAGGTEHTFHNTDRFMRAAGFDLFDFTKRTYSMAALPHRYDLNIPAQAIAGRPLQGDAVYLRDLAAPEFRETAEEFGPEKLLTLAILMSMIGQPDSAADVLLTFRSKLSSLIDVDRGLDLLTSETELGRATGWSYERLMAAFKRNDGMFYPG